MNIEQEPIDFDEIEDKLNNANFEINDDPYIGNYDEELDLYSYSEPIKPKQNWADNFYDPELTLVEDVSFGGNIESQEQQTFDALYSTLDEIKDTVSTISSDLDNTKNDVEYCRVKLKEISKKVDTIAENQTIILDFITNLSKVKQTQDI